jgi:putative tricarboxylic transport membrane protein
MEEQLRQSLRMSRGSFWTFYDNKLAFFLLCLSVVVLLIAALPSIRQSRDKVFVE